MKEVPSLKDIVSELTSGAESVIDPTVLAVIEAWQRVLPPSLRPVLCLEGFRDGLLFVLASHSVAAQQLQFQKDVLLAKMNRLLGKPLVTGIHVKTGFLSPHA